MSVVQAKSFAAAVTEVSNRGKEFSVTEVFDAENEIASKQQAQQMIEGGGSSSSSANKVQRIAELQASAA